MTVSLWKRKSNSVLSLFWPVMLSWHWTCASCWDVTGVNYCSKRALARPWWLANQLEYQFACSAPKPQGEQVYAAREYFHGHLDWYNLSIQDSQEGLGEVESADLPEDLNQNIVRSFIPTPVKFDGMPNTRWWAFEEGKTNFGDINPDTTDNNKLLLMEFGLVYANDWFLVPVTVPAGSIVNIHGLSVKNVFGENLWVTPTGRGLDDDPDRWTMYSLDIEGDSAPIEKVRPRSNLLSTGQGESASQLKFDYLKSVKKPAP